MNKKGRKSHFVMVLKTQFLKLKFFAHLVISVESAEIRDFSQN